MVARTALIPPPEPAVSPLPPNTARPPACYTSGPFHPRYVVRRREGPGRTRGARRDDRLGLRTSRIGAGARLRIPPRSPPVTIVAPVMPGRSRPDSGWSSFSNRSRVGAHKRTGDIEPRSNFLDASVDHTDARKANVRRFGRSDRSAQVLQVRSGRFTPLRTSKTHHRRAAGGRPGGCGSTPLRRGEQCEPGAGGVARMGFAGSAQAVGLRGSERLADVTTRPLSPRSLRLRPRNAEHAPLVIQATPAAWGDKESEAQGLVFPGVSRHVGPDRVFLRGSRSPPTDRVGDPDQDSNRRRPGPHCLHVRGTNPTKARSTAGLAISAHQPP
jgi:hypothetical protein